MSFRSRSARGSQKSTTNTVKAHDSLHRQRTMLSQTSWRSLPLIPNLIRSFSTTKSERNSGPDPHEAPETPEISGCGVCGLWKPRPSSYHDRKRNSQADKAHSLKDINEEEENGKRKEAEIFNDGPSEIHEKHESSNELCKNKIDADDEKIEVEENVTI